MDKGKRIEAVESAIYEVESLVAAGDVPAIHAGVVLYALRRKREMLVEQFNAEWSAYIGAESGNVN